MFWNKSEHEHNTNSSGAEFAGAVIGGISFFVLLAGIVATILVKLNPFVPAALWFIGDMGIGLSLALFWAGEHGISLRKLFGFLSAILLAFVGLSAAGVFAIGWIADTFKLNTPDGDTAISMLCLFGILVPVVLLYVAGMKWFERRYHY